MNDDERDASAEGIDQSFEIDAPPDKVWHAICDPELRKRWLPGTTLVEEDPPSRGPGEEARFRIAEDAPVSLDSIVRFRLSPNGTGGTTLRIVHRPIDPRRERMMLGPFPIALAHLGSIFRLAGEERSSRRCGASSSDLDAVRRAGKSTFGALSGPPDRVALRLRCSSIAAQSAPNRRTGQDVPGETVRPGRALEPANSNRPPTARAA